MIKAKKYFLFMTAFFVVFVVAANDEIQIERQSYPSSCQIHLKEMPLSSNQTNSNLVFGNFKPEEVWHSLGFDPNKMKLFFFNEIDIESEKKIIQLEVFYDGRTIMRLDLKESDHLEDVWRTSLSLIYFEDIKGRGVGLLVYVLAATKFYELYPDKILLSSFNQSPYAKKVWDKLVRSDFAFPIEGDPGSTNETYGPFRFDENALGSNVKNYVRQFNLRTTVHD